MTEMQQQQGAREGGRGFYQVPTTRHQLTHISSSSDTRTMQRAMLSMAITIEIMVVEVEVEVLPYRSTYVPHMQNKACVCIVTELYRAYCIIRCQSAKPQLREGMRGVYRIKPYVLVRLNVQSTSCRLFQGTCYGNVMLSYIRECTCPIYMKIEQIITVHIAVRDHYNTIKYSAEHHQQR